MTKVLITGGSGFIGTNCVAEALRRNWEVLSIDLEPPQDLSHAPFFHPADIRDASAILDLMRGFSPDFVIHLAAKTGMDESALNVFEANLTGVDNIMGAARACGTVQRIAVTSSLLVCRNGYIPRSDTDYCPPNAYGRSKVETELRTRAIPPDDLPWVICRPTSVWGPWFSGGYHRFFSSIKNGAYFHPGSASAIKAMTFVGNATHILYSFLQSEHSKVVGKTFYLVDWPPCTLRQWANVICECAGRHSIPTVPMPVIRSAALVGDLMKAVGVQDPPLTSFRLKNMLTSSEYPWAATREIVGELPYTLHDAVKLTLSWMEEHRGE
jgi:nucleoside-diphosphate-sugar epimerase